MTISAIHTETPQVQVRSRSRRGSISNTGSNVDFLERYISQLSMEKQLLQRNAESCITMLDLHIRKLAIERDLLLRERFDPTRRTWTVGEPQANLGSVPVGSLSQFLGASDMCNLGATCKQLYDQCRPADSKRVLSHLSTPTEYISLTDAVVLVETLCLSTVETLFIDAKRSSGKALLAALSYRSPELRSLRSLRVSAAAETGEFLVNLDRFMSGLSQDQIVSIHLSGFRSISLVSRLISRQLSSIERFKVDYFVNGHETDIETLPIMPRLRSFVFDVADVVHLPVHHISSLLRSIVSREAVDIIYLPHMQITGQPHEIIEFVDLVKGFSNVRQLVIRFRRLPLSVREIVHLRESFDSLPAVCISDHFIVMLDTWATWWPKQSTIWSSADKITGLSVFREQIDFESLGTTANREWLRLSREQKNLWSRRIAPNVVKLYLKA
jgi:hypothetical protein